MKKFVLLLAAMMLAQASFANSRRPECNIPYDLNSDEEEVTELRSFSISHRTALTTLQQRQVIAAANLLIEYYDYDYQTATVTNINQAIRILKNNSSGGDLVYIVFKFRGVVFSLVQVYPGDNPYGVVFRGRNAVAMRTDGDFTCI